jgi:hypothetical protein
MSEGIWGVKTTAEQYGGDNMGINLLGHDKPSFMCHISSEEYAEPQGPKIAEASKLFSSFFR